MLEFGVIASLFYRAHARGSSVRNEHLTRHGFLTWYWGVQKRVHYRHASLLACGYKWTLFYRTNVRGQTGSAGLTARRNIAKNKAMQNKGNRKKVEFNQIFFYFFCFIMRSTRACGMVFPARLALLYKKPCRKEFTLPNTAKISAIWAKLRWFLTLLALFS